MKERIKTGEAVVFKSDKSNKLTVDSLEKYTEALSVHTSKDTKIEMERVKQIEKEMNRTQKHFNKMFCVGEAHPPDRRIAEAATSTNVLPPPLYGMRKDHKSVPPGQESVGPPVRPVCAAKEGPNVRLSSFLTRILNDFADAVDQSHECKSSEEMRVSFEKYNINTSDDIRIRCVLLSMDLSSISQYKTGCNCPSSPGSRQATTRATGGTSC